jgi:serine protease Do
MVLRIQPAQQSSTGTPFLPVDFKRWIPSKNEEVMALGYAEIDKDQYNHGENRSISAHLYGSVGRIIDIESADPNRGRPWPHIRVEAEWPGGMSGSPVFNDLGHVIGVVSTGLYDVGTAALFSGWNIPQQIFGSVDPVNPNFFYCYGVFNEAGTLVWCGQEESGMKEFAKNNRLIDYCVISINPFTQDYIRL